MPRACILDAHYTKIYHLTAFEQINIVAVAAQVWRTFSQLLDPRAWCRHAARHDVTADAALPLGQSQRVVIVAGGAG